MDVQSTLGGYDCPSALGKVGRLRLNRYLLNFFNELSNEFVYGSKLKAETLIYRLNVLGGMFLICD